ncbi:MAG: hypothetical protein Q8T08_10020, partial [Ignavibacteria bacterium]|nr:hypothetical protein [Ignavibacteria bacterium]
MTKPKLEYSIEDLERLNIGIESTIGIDGFALIINNKYIDSIAELDDFLEENKKALAEVVFIQSKRTPSFSSRDIENFGSAVSDFIAEAPRLPWPRFAKDRIALFSKFVERIAELKEQPKASLYYVCLGTAEGANDSTIQIKANQIKEKIRTATIFKDIEIYLYSKQDLIDAYIKI